jgi:Uncharacterized protein with a C-terminal OMP (outer membrane protein) domain
MSSSLVGRVARVIAWLCLHILASSVGVPAISVAAAPQACVDGVTGVPSGGVVLRGNYICAGVSNVGTLGVGGYYQPGIVYDPGGNVLANGREYLALGVPYDGFSLQADNISYHGVSNDQWDYYGYYYTSPVPGAVVDQSSGTLNQATWSGGTSSYDMTKVYSFNDDAQKIDISVTITAKVDIVNLRYLRSVDPDIAASAVTYSGLGREHLSAEDFVYTEIPGTGAIFAIYSDSSVPHRAGIYASCCSLTQPDTFLNGTNAGSYGDYSIGIGFTIGDLKTGESVTLTYSYLFAVNLEVATEEAVPVMGSDDTVTSEDIEGGNVNPVFNGGTFKAGGSAPVTTAFIVNTAGGTFDTDGHDVNYSGDLTGNGQLNKTGQGTLTYSGTATNTGGLGVTGGALVLTPAGSITGNVNVNGGTFTANGSVGGTVTVTNGTVYGTGTVGGLAVNAGGILAPGNSPGTITVNGPFALSPGGTLQVEVQSDGVADKVIVNGTVNLAGDLDVIAIGPGFSAAGFAAVAYRYLIIENDGVDAVNGTFSAIGSNLVFLTATVDYLAGTGNDVELTLTRAGATFASVATTQNQLTVATGIDATQPYGDAIFTGLLSSNEAQAVAAFDNLSGEIYASLPTMLASHAQSRIEDTGRKAMSVRDADCDIDCMIERSFSIVATGGLRQLESNGNAAATGMWLGGLEANVILPMALSDGGELLFGGTLAYEAGRLHVASRGSSAEIVAGSFAGFVGYGNGPLELFGSFGGQLAASSVTRDVAVGAASGTAEADLWTASLGGAVGLAYALDFDGDFTLRPFMVLSHVGTGGQSFSETGLGSFSISGVTGAVSGTRLTIGTAVSTEFEWDDYTLSPFAEIALTRELGDRTGSSANSATGFGGTLDIGGVSLADTTLNAAMGLSVNNGRGLTFDGSYSLSLSRNEHSSAGKVGLRVNF